MIRTSLIAAAAALALAPATLMASSVVNATYNGMQYRVYLPDSYTANGADMPVTLYLHSAAERGTSVNDIFGNSYGGFYWDNSWIDALVEETQHGTHQSILVMPQSGLNTAWSSFPGGNWGYGSYTNVQDNATADTVQLANAIQITKNVVANYNSDSNRVYVTGPSLGGYGTWEAIAKNPTLFAAAIPIAGGGNTDLAKTTLANKPIWTYTGGSDSVVPSAGTVDMYFAMRQAGGSPIMTNLGTVDHTGWEIMYNDSVTVDRPNSSGGSGQSVYDWLFSQTLDKPNVLKPLTQGTAPVVIGFGAGASGTGRANYTANGKNFIAYNFVESKDITGATDINRFTTGIYVKRLAGSLGPGGYSGNLSGSIADEITNDCKGALWSSSGPLKFEIGGLDDSKQYVFDIFGTTNGNVGQVVTSQYVLAGDVTRTGTMNVVNNASNVFTVTDVRSVNGIVTLTVNGLNGSWAYLSSLVITPVAVPEPASMGLLAIGAVGLLRRRRA